MKQWTGIPVSVGIAKTKTLAKIAAHVAKRNPDFEGMFDLEALADVDGVLAAINIGEVWGIGKNLKAKLNAMAIESVLDLKQANEVLLKKKFGILTLRTVMELRGVACFPMEPVAAPKTMRIVSRSFGYLITEFADIKEVVSIYTTRYAEKLRDDGLMATIDDLNRKLKPDAVKLRAMGLNPSWQMRSEYFSQCYTTHWNEIPGVKVWNPRWCGVSFGSPNECLTKCGVVTNQIQKASSLTGVLQPHNCTKLALALLQGVYIRNP